MMFYESIRFSMNEQVKNENFGETIWMFSLLLSSQISKLIYWHHSTTNDKLTRWKGSPGKRKGSWIRWSMEYWIDWGEKHTIKGLRCGNCNQIQSCLVGKVAHIIIQVERRWTKTILIWTCLWMRLLPREGLEVSIMTPEEKRRVIECLSVWSSSSSEQSGKPGFSYYTERQNRSRKDSRQGGVCSLRIELRTRE